MPTVAIFADIHGNMPALEAVLADLEAVAPDEVLVGGDLVGRGPEGSRVIAAVRERGWPSVRGNHEEYLLGFRAGEVPDEWLEADEWSASRFMSSELSEEDAAWIAALPLALEPRVGDGLRLVHGSPRSTNHGLGPWCSDAELESVLDEAGGGVLVCGHTHRPMRRRLEGGEIVNVGSVGLPFNGDRRAQYALFHHDDQGWRVEPRRIAYDVERTLEIYRSSGFLEEGGVTARLLAMELERATPYLVPFLKWCEALGLTPRPGRIGEFLDFYDPDEPLYHLFRRLRELAG